MRARSRDSSKPKLYGTVLEPTACRSASAVVPSGFPAEKRATYANHFTQIRLQLNAKSVTDSTMAHAVPTGV